MGLSSTTPIQFYLGDGSSTVFPFPYEFFTQKDLQVFLFDTTTAIIYPQTIGSNFSVFGSQSYNGTYPSGGGITTTSAFPSTTELIIFRNPQQVQNYGLTQGGPINSLALVQQLDYLTAIAQALQYQASQSLSLQAGQGQINGSSFSMLLPSNIGISACSALLFLQVNSGATGWQLATMGSSSGGGGGSFTGSISLTNQVMGILPFANGGTNFVGPYAISSLIFASSGQEFFSVPPGAPGQFLTFQGSSTPTWTSSTSTGSTNLTNQVMGILPFANGGTNAVGPYSVSGVIYGSGGAQFASVFPGTPGQVLTFQGSSVPTWTTVSASGSTSLTTGVSGILPTANGGTNNAGPYQLAGIIFASTATQFAAVPPGTPGQVLTFQGSSTPTWSTINAGSVSLTTGVSGILPLLNGGTGTPAASANAAFNALSPITAGGQMIAGSGITNFAVPAGTLGQALISQGVAPPAWQTISNGSTAILTTIITTCSMVLSAPTTLILANSSQMTIQLFSAVGNAGAQVRVKKIDSSNGVVSISASGAATTFDGSINPLQLIAQNEEFEICCDGTNWQITDYYHQPVWMRWFAASLAVTASFQTIGWRGRDYDTFNIMSGNGNMIVNRAGKWNFEVNVIGQHTGVTSDNVNMAIIVNGVQKSQLSNDGITTNTTMTSPLNDTYVLNLNDAVAIQYEDTNTAPIILSGTSLSYVTAKYLGQ